MFYWRIKPVVTDEDLNSFSFIKAGQVHVNTDTVLGGSKVSSEGAADILV